jgi:hypothetical protein
VTLNDFDDVDGVDDVDDVDGVKRWLIELASDHLLQYACPLAWNYFKRLRKYSTRTVGWSG